MESQNYFYRNNNADAQPSDGVLHGTRLTIQPNLSVRQWPIEAGSLCLENFKALEDAAIVEFLKSSGASIEGSTRMSEFGFGLAGDSAAAALKGGGIDASFMTDILGEARYAASSINAFGFKPSYGICSRFGLIGIIPSMECISIMAFEADSILKLMSVIAVPDERDFSMLWQGIPDFYDPHQQNGSIKTAGIIKEQMAQLTPDEQNAVRQAATALSSRGITCIEVSMADFGMIRTVHNIIGSVEASSAAGKFDGVRYGHRTPATNNWNEMYLKSRGESFGSLIKSYLFQGAYFQFKDFAAFEDACRIRGRLLQQINTLFEKIGVLLSPVRSPRFDAIHVNSVSDVYNAFSMTIIANLLGLPALSIPGYMKIGEIDFGLQLIAPHLSDPALLSLARRLSQ